MFNPRGGFPGQGIRPLIPHRMKQPGMNLSGMNVSGMNQQPMGLSGMNQQPMGLSGMNQQPMGLSGMNQQPMGLSGMNQQSMGLPGMNKSGMGLPGMNQQGMGLPGMNQQGMGLSGMNQQGIGLPGMNRSGIGSPGINIPGGIGHAGLGPPGMNQSGMNLNRMNHPGMNQGGMGFHPEMRNTGLGMRSHGLESPGSFIGGSSDPVGMKNLPSRTPMNATPERALGPQAFQKRFVGASPAPRPVQPRTQSQAQDLLSLVNMMTKQSPSDLMMGKGKLPLQGSSQFGKEKLWQSGTTGNLSQDMGMKSTPSPQLDRLPEHQNRYTNESASSILESFGLSNEDLEELSRYPDDQLTPANMPVILRDIRLRKLGRSGTTPDQGGLRRSGGEVLPSKVIDYGHSSKYQFEDPIQSYDSPRMERKSERSPPKSEPKKTNVSKVPPASTNASSVKANDKSMDNKIPTISNTRKKVSSWQASKMDRPSNKPGFGEQPSVQAAEKKPDVSSSEKNIMGGVQPEVPAIANRTEAPPNPQMGSLTGPVTYPPPLETTSVPTSGSWTSALPQADIQKNRNPTPSMMNDYYAASPRLFPHICSLCNIECRHLKDWIKHQNTPAHIESCRKLRLQYPQWNPQVLSSISDGNKSDDGSTKRWKSHSSSPRRSRGSASRSRARRSRSKSPRSSGRLRSRSRSPRRPRRSPRRSRSPRRRSRSPRRSLSPRRPRHARISRTRSASPDKKAVDAAVANFIESTKAKSGSDKTKSVKTPSNGEKVSPKSASSTARTKKPDSSTSSSKKPSTGSSTITKASSVSSSGSSKKGSSTSSSKRPTSSTTTRKTSTSSSSPKKPSSSSSAVKKPLSTSSSAKKPPRSSSDKNVPAPAQKATPGGKKPFQSKLSAGNKETPAPPRASAQSPVDAFNPLHKFKSKSNSGTIIHVTNLPDFGYTDQDIMKIVQQFGKVSDILIIRSKNEAYLQTNFKEAATAAVKFSETVPVMVNNTRVTLSLAGQKKEPEKVQVKVEVKKPSQKKPPREVIPSGFIKTYKLAEPMFQDTERCVILVSNLPEGQSGVEEISNLAKPFGGVVDIIFVSTHRKAYLQLSNKSSTDSMIKFYDVFPTFISGNAVSIAVNPKFKDLKDEDRIFAEIIEQSPHKIKPSIYENFVHLSNLPEKGYTEFEIVCIGLRFGKVEHYAIFANKKKAILHMCNANAAKAMHSFLSQYPCSIGESLLSCSVPSKTKMEEGEYVMTLEEEKKSSREVESTPVETETTQTADEDSVKGKKCQEKAATSALPETTTATTTSLASTPAAAAAAPLPIGKEEEKVKPSMTPSPVSGSDEEESTVVKDTTVEQNEQPEESMPIDMEPTKPAEQAFSEQVSDNEMEEQPTHDAELEIIGAEAVTEDEEYGDDDDDDYEEEAAEAPEAPDAEISELIQTESVVSMVNSEADDLPKFPLSEELEVLVSVESEEEEEEEEEEVVVGVMDLGNSKNCQQKQVCPDINMIDDIGVTACEENEDIEGVTVDPEPEDEMGKSSESPKKLGEDAKTEMFEEPKQTVQPVQEQTQKSISVGKCSEVSNVSEPPNSKGNLGKELDSSVTSTESTDQTNKAEVANEKESKSEGDSVSFSTKKNKESKISEETIKESGDLKSSSALRRTAKYNPQKGDISVTLSVDNQRSTSKSDTRKRSSAETRSSGRESSTPKSSSSRSSPAETPGSNPKSSASSQKKNSGKGAPSQQDRDSKATSKSWERETRSSSRKDDWSKNFSQRHQRSSKVSSRGPKSNEGQEKEQFPFDLEEFVTVDEIVEEQSDTQRAKEESKTPQGANGSRKAKRKEHEQSPSEAKKSKGKNTTTHTASKEQSFVTLDEVGDEDDGTPGPESTLTKEAQSLVTVDEVHAEDGQSEDVKVGQELMTLDEISDEEDVNQDTASGLVLTEIPEDLSKEPLLVTLDEVIAEEEETALKSKSPNVENSSLKDAEKKEKKDKSKQSSTKDHPAVDLTEQPLLTLDEVKGDDDVESIADIVGFNEGHQFFTVDEVGEEEEDSSMPSETVTESTVKTDGIKTPEPCENKPDQKSKAIEDSPVVTPRRGRPRKRPLVEKSTPTPADSKSPDSSQKPSAVETPAKQNGKISKAGESPATEKPASADSATPSKKKKVESPSKESPKLGPFNPSTPIGMEFMVPKTGFFCELCSLFYMDDASKLKHCKSLRHYQAIEKHMAKEAELPSKDSKEA